jgi:dimethylargininase
VRIAITRAVSPRIAECELTWLERQPIDFALAAEQHDAYERALASLGCTIVRVADAPDMPDGVFVEDAAVVLDDVAIIARPGAESRRGETAAVAEVLKNYRPLRAIEAPGTLDGGDVLVAGGRMFVGLSRRTNLHAVEQLGATAVTFRGCLHLKSAVTQIAEGKLLFNPDYVDAFPGFECIAVDPSEPHAANALPVGDVLIYSASFPRTRRILESRGFRVHAIDVSELEKAEAGVTCCSLQLTDNS